MVLPSGRSKMPRAWKNRVSSGATSGQIAGIGHFQVQRRDGAQAADILKARIVAEARQPLLLHARQRGDALPHRLVAPDLQIGAGGGAGDGIGGEGTGMKKGAAAVGGIMRVENLLRAQGRRQRQRCRRSGPWPGRECRAQCRPARRRTVCRCGRSRSCTSSAINSVPWRAQMRAMARRTSGG